MRTSKHIWTPIPTLKLKGVSNICSSIIKIDELVCEYSCEQFWKGNKENINKKLSKTSLKCYTQIYIKLQLS